jgi:hypothetical protein
MSESEDDSRTFITVAIEARRWQGLKFEADLLTQVFGMPITPQSVAQRVFKDALKARVGRPAQ